MNNTAKEDFKMNFNDVYSELHMIRAYRSIDGMKEKDLEEMAEMLGRVSSDVNVLENKLPPLSPCKTLEEAKDYEEVARTFFNNLKSSCTALCNMQFEGLFNSVHEDIAERAINNIVEYLAVIKGYGMAALVYYKDNGVRTTMSLLPNPSEI